MRQESEVRRDIFKSKWLPHPKARKRFRNFISLSAWMTSLPHLADFCITENLIQQLNRSGRSTLTCQMRGASDDHGLAQEGVAGCHHFGPFCILFKHLQTHKKGALKWVAPFSQWFFFFVFFCKAQKETSQLICQKWSLIWIILVLLFY